MFIEFNKMENLQDALKEGHVMTQICYCVSSGTSSEIISFKINRKH